MAKVLLANNNDDEINKNRDVEIQIDDKIEGNSNDTRTLHEPNSLRGTEAAGNLGRCHLSLDCTNQTEDVNKLRCLLMVERHARIKTEKMARLLMLLLWWQTKILLQKVQSSGHGGKESTIGKPGGRTQLVISQITQNIGENRAQEPLDIETRTKNKCTGLLNDNDSNNTDAKGNELPVQEADSHDAKKSSFSSSPATDATENNLCYDAETEDTMELARRIRRDQGSYEVQINCGGEADLHKHMNECEKNPGHANFCPVYKFNKDFLPERYQDDVLVECIQALSDLTVHITVTCTNEQRSEGMSRVNSKNPITKGGTGWVLVVKEFPVWYSNITCSCEQCRGSQNPETKFALIVIYTAGHVVCNDAMGAHTTCHLFFDKCNTPEECPGVITLTGMSRVKSDTKGDRCEMAYFTHDLNLADRLHKMVKRFRHLKAMVSLRFPMSLGPDEGRSYKKQCPSDSDNSLTVIISHPHGCSKQVSVGNFTIREVLEDGRDVTKYTYTTPTCDGSSGAPVFVVGMTPWGMCEHPHRATLQTHPQLNYSGYGFY